MPWQVPAAVLQRLVHFVTDPHLLAFALTTSSFRRAQLDAARHIRPNNAAFFLASPSLLRWGCALGCRALTRLGKHLPPWHLIANFPGFLYGKEPSYLFQALTFTRTDLRAGRANVLTDKHGAICYDYTGKTYRRKLTEQEWEQAAFVHPLIVLQDPLHSGIKLSPRQPARFAAPTERGFFTVRELLHALQRWEFHCGDAVHASFEARYRGHDAFEWAGGEGDPLLKGHGNRTYSLPWQVEF